MYMEVPSDGLSLGCVCGAALGGDGAAGRVSWGLMRLGKKSNRVWPGGACVQSPLCRLALSSQGRASGGAQPKEALGFARLLHLKAGAAASSPLLQYPQNPGPGGGLHWPAWLQREAREPLSMCPKLGPIKPLAVSGARN